MIINISFVCHFSNQNAHFVSLWGEIAKYCYWVLVDKWTLVYTIIKMSIQWSKMLIQLFVILVQRT